MIKIKNGYSTVELILTITLATLFLTLAGLSINNLLRRDHLQIAVTEIKSALYQAQSQSLNHYPTGVRFETNRFILFFGEQYQEANPQNQITTFASQIEIASITLPNQTVTYNPLTGYLNNFTPPANLTLLDQQTGRSYLVSLNRLGTVIIE